MKLLLVVLLTVFPLSALGLRRSGKAVTVVSFVWNLQEPNEVKTDLKSPITIDLIAQIAPQSDSIRGKNLWKFGIFGSEHNDGHGERVGFKSQILKPKQASKRATKGSPLKMKNIFSRFDLSQIGCSEVRYFCVEFTKNSESTVDFEFRWGSALDSIVSCKEMECRRPYANATVTGRETLQALLVPPPTARLSHVQVEATVCGAGKVALLVFVYSDGFTDTIRGNGLWRLGVFLSNATNGAMTRVQYQPDILNAKQKAKPLTPGFPIFLGLFTTLDAWGVGCPGYDLQYICVEFNKGENPTPEFQLSGGSVIACDQVVCPIPHYDFLKALTNSKLGWF